MAPPRRRQLAAIAVLMPLAAIAELVTISALIPFLALLADASVGRGAGWIATLVTIVGARTRTDMLVAAAALFALAAIGSALLRLLLSWMTQRFAFGLGHDWAVEVQRRILLQPYSFHLQHNSSQMIAALGKIERMVFNVVLPLLNAATAMMLSAFIVGALVMIDATSAAIAALLVIVVYGAALFAIRRRLARNSESIGLAYEKRVQTVQESLGGIRDIILDHSQPAYVEAFRAIDERFMRASTSTAFLAAAPRYAIEALGLLLLTGVAIIISGRAGGLADALPVLGALTLAAQRLLPLTQQLYYGWTTISSEQAVVRDVAALLQLPIDEAALLPADRPPIAFAHEIRLEGVTFHYSGRARPAVEDINLVIERGARIAIIGRTGSGKSSLADLLMGLLEPTEGSISIDGLPLSKSTIRAWQNQVAHVPQSIFLADASIARNIAFSTAGEALDLSRVEQAANIAQLSDFIAALPDGLDTMVGERGVRLSGGQRQRLGLARAIYKNAPVLILDEATSALDDETEASVLAALDALRGQGRTIIIIAHRDTTIKSCDAIVRLDHGRIVEVVRR